MTHLGFALEDDRADRLRAGDRAGVVDELPHLLVDVGGDDDCFVVFARVGECGHERGEGLAGAGRALEEHVAGLLQRVGDPVDGLALVRIRRLVGEEPEVVVRGCHTGPLAATD